KQWPRAIFIPMPRWWYLNTTRKKRISRVGVITSIPGVTMPHDYAIKNKGSLGSLLPQNQFFLSTTQALLSYNIYTSIPHPSSHQIPKDFTIPFGHPPCSSLKHYHYHIIPPSPPSTFLPG
ncbi:hypothetical protein PanWU01x14_284030, partial [Parasponia andersonii]